MSGTRLLLAAALALLPSLARANGELMVLAMLRPPPTATPAAPPEAPPAYLAIPHQSVEVEIADHAAVTRVRQQFQNELAGVLEGRYEFRLAPAASVSDFAIWDGDTRVPAVIRRREEARAIYESIVARNRDPGLLEQVAPGLFDAHVFPILPHSEKRIEIEYRELLHAEDGVACYRYPLTAARSDVPTPADLALTVDLRDGAEITAAWSPVPGVSIHHHDAHHVTATWNAHQASQDLLLYYTVKRPASGLQLLAHRPDPGRPGYFQLSISPPSTGLPDRAKDVVFVVDTSGSMEGQKIEQARRALTYCLKTLAPDDRFDVLRFSTDVEPLSPRLIPATPGAIASAITWVDRLKAHGDTAIDAALTAALATFRPPADRRPRYVVFLTDGEPTNGETNPDQIREHVRTVNTSRARLFTFGIDEAEHLPLLAGLADDNRGESISVRATDDLSTLLPLFFSRLTVPLFEDAELTWTGITPTAVHPARLPHFYLGRQLVVLGRYPHAAAATLRLSATVDGRRVTYDQAVTFPDQDVSGAQIPRLWAQQEVDALMDNRDPGRLPTEITEEVVRLSTEHRFATPLTSFIAVPDPERERLPESLRDLLDGDQHLVSRTGPDGRTTVELTAARPLGPVLDELGRLGGFRVELPPGLSRDTKVTFEATSPAEAVAEVVRAQGFEIEGPLSGPVIRITRPAPHPEEDLVLEEPERTRFTGGHPTDFDFKDVELANIFQTIATLGGFHIIIDPQVARARMVVRLKQVAPLDALFLVAKMQELKVKRVKWDEGSTTVTYAIGRSDKIGKAYETANSRTVQLKYAKAEDVATILARGLGKDVNLGVERDPRTNRLLLKGTDEVLSKVQDLVRDLDLPMHGPNANAGVSSIDANRPASATTPESDTRGTTSDLDLEGLEAAPQVRQPPTKATLAVSRSSLAVPSLPLTESAMELLFRELQQRVASLRTQLHLLRLRLGAAPGAAVIEAVELDPAPIVGGARTRISLRTSGVASLSWTALSGVLSETSDTSAVWEAPLFPGLHQVRVQLGATTATIELVVFAPGQITYSPEFLEARVAALEAELRDLASEHADLLRALDARR